MTREEAIKEFESELKWAELNIYPYVSKQKIEANKIAIKALEQEPTTKDLVADCISRADAIHAVSEALKHTFVEYEDIANKVIGKLPSVTPQEPRWIPVSERLPEKATKVLVQAEDLYYCMNGDKGVIIGWHNGRYWNTYTVQGSELIRYPVAWMPLPKPYEPQESEE